MNDKEKEAREAKRKAFREKYADRADAINRLESRNATLSPDQAYVSQIDEAFVNAFAMVREKHPDCVKMFVRLIATSSFDDDIYDGIDRGVKLIGVDENGNEYIINAEEFR